MKKTWITLSGAAIFVTALSLYSCNSKTDTPATTTEQTTTTTTTKHEEHEERKREEPKPEPKPAPTPAPNTVPNSIVEGGKINPNNAHHNDTLPPNNTPVNKGGFVKQK